MEENNKEEIKEEIKKEIVNEQNQVENQNQVDSINTKHKSNKPFVIIIVILAMALTFGCGIMLGKELFESKKSNNKKETEVVDNNQNEENENVNNTKENEVVNNNTEGKENSTRVYLDINDETVQKLFNIFRYDNEHCFLIGEALNSNNLARLRIAYNSLSENSKREMSCSSLIGVIKYGNNEISGYCGSHLNDEMKKYYVDSEEFEKAALTNTTTYVYAKDLQDKYNELFSSNYLYTNESFGWNIGLEPDGQFMKYYDDKGIYALYNCECGGICGLDGHIINSAYKVENSLFIETTLNQAKINYEFRLENGTYKFVKVVESKSIYDN